MCHSHMELSLQIEKQLHIFYDMIVLTKPER